MSVQTASRDHAGAQEVQREVAGPGADLQRAVEARRRAAERLAHLAEHLRAADLAEVDAPLGVVVGGRDVVVAGVDVADGLVGWRGRPWARASVPARSLESGAAAWPPTSPRSSYLQRDQPEGVPPLALTGERTLPDVPEENYWYRRHLVVYEWIAARVGGAARRRHGLRRGLRLRRARPRGALASSASRPTPRPTSTRACATRRARTCASSAAWSRSTPSRATRSCSCRRSSTSPNPDAVLEHFKAHARGPVGDGYVSTPERPDARARGRGALGQPVARQGVPRRGVRRAVPRALRATSSCSASSTRASCARTSSRCASRWDDVHRRLGITRAFYDRFTPAISERDFALRSERDGADLDGALDLLAVCRP